MKYNLLATAMILTTSIAVLISPANALANTNSGHCESSSSLVLNLGGSRSLPTRLLSFCLKLSNQSGSPAFVRLSVIANSGL